MIRENQKYPGPGDMGTDPQEELAVDQASDAGVTDGTEPVKPARKVSKGKKAVQEFLGGDYLSREWVTGNLAFIFYLALLAMIYIANTYYTEKKFKTIERTKSELKELRYEYITTKSALMFQGRQSEISQRALLQGLKETKMPPFKILYSGEALRNGKP